MKKISTELIFKLLNVCALIAALVLEALPSGAVLKFSADPAYNAEPIYKYYSYFDFTPFGNANFAPLITAILTVLLLAFAIVLTVLRKYNSKLNVILFAVCATATFISVCPALYGLDYLTGTAIGISVLLAAATVFSAFVAFPWVVSGNQNDTPQENA